MRTGSPPRTTRTIWHSTASKRRVAVAGERLHRRVHALDVAAVVGAEHVDQHVEAARHLVGVVGDVVGEIRVAAVGFAQRPVHVVAELGGAEQGLRARLPVVRGLAFGRLQRRPRRSGRLRGEPVDHRVGGAAVDQRTFGTEHFLRDAERAPGPRGSPRIIASMVKSRTVSSQTSGAAIPRSGCASAAP